MRIIAMICACIQTAVVPVVLMLNPNAEASTRRPIEPSDCVTVRHFLEGGFHPSMQLDPQGTRAAYLVQSPNLQTNENDVVLDVTDVGGDSARNLPILVGTKLAQPHWLRRGDSIAVLANWQGRVSVVEVAVPSGRVTALVKAAKDIVEYSISRDGHTIVYAVEKEGNSGTKQTTSEEEAHGYRVSIDKQSAALFPERQLFLVRRTNAGWSVPKLLSLRLPSLRRPLNSFPYAVDLRLSVAPDGSALALTLLVNLEDAPPDWKQSGIVRAIAAGAGVVQLTPVITLKDGNATLPFQTPWAWTVPFWSGDSQAFVMSAVSPVGSEWEAEDSAKRRAPIEAVHQFEVRPLTGIVRLVRSDLGGSLQPPLAWSGNGDLLLRGSDRTLIGMRYSNLKWSEMSRVELVHTGDFRNEELASDGKIVVGDYETPSTPPSFFSMRVGQQHFDQLVNLNPEFDRLTLAPYREVRWQTSTGYHASGFLFVPPNYDPTKRYPLVIHAYPAASNFFCDSGKNHDPSFAPQPLANAGIMYLIRILPDGMHTSEERNHYPTGFPGTLAEAAFQTDIWDSAVDQLTHDGLVDPTRVGIIGFSRSGWYTEFALTHGRTHFAAATVADNVQYSVGEYWMIHSDSVLKGSDAMYGGPPYGKTLQNWLDHSISFNLPKIQAPLLMEVMGYGNHYTNDNAPPGNLALKWEVYAGLKHLGKPVELYFYPLETHQPEHPQARLASLARNLAWFSFWLRDVEQPDPDDPERFVRWERMRQGAASNSSAQAEQ